MVSSTARNILVAVAADPRRNGYRLARRKILALLIISLGTRVAFADPPSSTAVALKVHLGTETVAGYALYSEMDALELHQPLEEGTIKTLLLKHPPFLLYPMNMKRVDSPTKFSYVYTEPPRRFDKIGIDQLEIGSGELAGHVPYTSPFYQVNADLERLLDDEPKFHCYLQRTDAGTDDDPGVEMLWVSYNGKVGKNELASECSKKAPSGLSRNKWGKHPKFPDVFWFALAVSD